MKTLVALLILAFSASGYASQSLDGMVGLTHRVSSGKLITIYYTNTYIVNQADGVSEIIIDDKLVTLEVIANNICDLTKQWQRLGSANAISCIGK